MAKRIQLVPLTLREANELISRLHRHHKPVQGHRFTIGAKNESLIGAAVVGRPTARMTNQYLTAEVTRLVSDGSPNVCSLLYSTCARAATAMGYHNIKTFILASELGTSLRASGWYRIKADGEKCGCKLGCDECMTQGGDWNRPSRGGRRTDQPMMKKQRWGKKLRMLERGANG